MPRQRSGLVVFAKNKKRVSTFYQRALGLKAVERAPGYDVLQNRDIEIVVHAIPRAFAADIVITKPPALREDSAFKPAFFVADLNAVWEAARATGGSLKPLEAAWVMRGVTVLDGCDPEGNVVQFKQLGQPTRRPSVR